MTEQSWNDPTKDGDDWDPAISERAYYEHTQTGDRGWVVRRDGANAIKLDRVGVDEIRTFSAAEWKPVLSHRPLTRHAITLVAFEADKRLCIALGDHEKGHKEWASLVPEKKRAWMSKGPKDPPIRAELYKAIMEVLGPLAE